jgi:hypothetical protein
MTSQAVGCVVPLLIRCLRHPSGDAKFGQIADPPDLAEDRRWVPVGAGGALGARSPPAPLRARRATVRPAVDESRAAAR